MEALNFDFEGQEPTPGAVVLLRSPPPELSYSVPKTPVSSLHSNLLPQSALPRSSGLTRPTLFGGGGHGLGHQEGTQHRRGRMRRNGRYCGMGLRSVQRYAGLQRTVRGRKGRPVHQNGCCYPRFPLDLRTSSPLKFVEPGHGGLRCAPSEHIGRGGTGGGGPSGGWKTWWKSFKWKETLRPHIAQADAQLPHCPI